MSAVSVALPVQVISPVGNWLWVQGVGRQPPVPGLTSPQMPLNWAR